MAAAVGDSVVDHFDGVCWDVAMGVSQQKRGISRFGEILCGS